jgi:TM2 domain-containing membrane protein YozV
MTLTEEQKKEIEEQEKYRQEIIASQTKRTHGLPALLSFFIPGLGQIIKGEVVKGIFAFIGVAIGLVVLVIPGIIIWIWQISDAYSNNSR